MRTSARSWRLSKRLEANTSQLVRSLISWSEEVTDACVVPKLTGKQNVIGALNNMSTASTRSFQ